MIDLTWTISPGYLWIRTVGKGMNDGTITRLGSGTNPYRVNDEVVFRKEDIKFEAPDTSVPGAFMVLLPSIEVGAYRRI